MRCVLLAFVLGVVLLQQQATLPPLAWAAAVAIPLLLASAASWGRRRCTGWRACTMDIIELAAFAVAAGGSGFFYAAWRAETRLADEFPRAWEGRDNRVVGVIDELPQPIEGGVRFAFAVERVLTHEAIIPSEISLAWYAGFARDVQTRAVPELHAGERWELKLRLKRPHGTVNPHGFDVEAWLLENDLRATGCVRDDEGNHRLDAFAGRPDDSLRRTASCAHAKRVARRRDAASLATAGAGTA